LLPFLHRCVQAWLLALSWVLLLQLPTLYTHNRLVILTVLRLLMAWAASKSNNCCLQAQLHNPLQAQEGSAAITMFVQLLLVTNTVHIPMLAVRLPMPILLQTLLTAAQPVLLVWGGMTQGEPQLGMAWSRIDRNPGLQARAVPACCTGDLNVKNP
jgi:hypothetical protein